MKTFSSDFNDGTLLITKQVSAPLQGTLTYETEGKIVLGKGIVRPPIVTEYGDKEDEQIVEDAAFKKSFVGARELQFYSLNALNDQKCSLGKQSIYFACKDPAAFVRKDNERFRSLSAFDFMSKNATRKIKAGVPPAMLIETAAVWNMYDKFEIQGVRTLAIASELVPSGTVSANEESARFEEAFATLENDTYIPAFYLMVDTAVSLAKQIGCQPHEMKGKYFLIHRDPSLPDGTSLVPMMCIGFASWETGDKHYGIVFHPKNPYWKAMGGDFDGDYAVCLKPTEQLLPRGALPRASYRLKGKKYDSDNILDRMIQDAEDSTTSLLGPAILGAMRLVERELDNDSIRSVCASVAQASVEAKKHVVDSETVNTEFQYIMREIRDGSMNGAYPYISDFTNEISNTKSFESKTELWQKLITLLPIWTNGTALEKALCERLQLLDNLFQDIEFFRHQKRTTLPQALVQSAQQLASPAATEAMKELTKYYNSIARQLQEVEYTGEDDRDSFLADIRDELKALGAKFNLATVTGLIGCTKTSILDAQYAMIGYGPGRLAARFVPAEVFEALGTVSKRIITQLIGTEWKNGEYTIEDIKPIPSCKSDVDHFLQNITSVKVTVIKNSPNSTRVLLENC